MTTARGRGVRSGRVRVSAPAKINLGLEVLGKRPDGYHELVTIFQSISLADRLELELLDEPRVELVVEPPGLDLGPAEGNLAVRAVRALLPAAGRWCGARIVLRKRIPVGAGLGGGSSDGAAALVGTARLLRGLGVACPQPRAVAPALGADVPFFLRGGTQLGTGRGDLLRPLSPWPSQEIVVVFPNVSVATSSVFRQLECALTPPGPLARMAALETPSWSWETDRSELRNDLEPIVAREHPRVVEALEAFRGLGCAFARMSGSGSAVFGTTGDPARAGTWVEAFRARGYWATRARPTRAGCRVRRIAAAAPGHGIGRNR